MAFGNRLGREQELVFHFGLFPTVAQALHFNKDGAPDGLPLKPFFRWLARLSLGANHAVGAFVGRLVFAFSPRYRNRLLENLGSSGLAPTRERLKEMAKENAREIGKSATELAWALFRPVDEVVGLVKSRTGW